MINGEIKNMYEVGQFLKVEEEYNSYYFFVLEVDYLVDNEPALKVLVVNWENDRCVENSGFCFPDRIRNLNIVAKKDVAPKAVMVVQTYINQKLSFWNEIRSVFINDDLI